jgi:tetratricopeptide (TPR) repeat protein
MMHDAWRWALLLLLGMGLAACGVTPPADEPAAGPSPQEEAPAVQGSAGAQANPAVVALLNSAGAKEQAGSYEQAAAALERALRLEPRNAMLWHRLARVRLKQGQWQTAVDTAAKSNSLAGGNAELQAWNWAVIAEAKERQGDRLGAQDARTRVDSSRTNR